MSITAVVLHFGFGAAGAPADVVGLAMILFAATLEAAGSSVWSQPGSGPATMPSALGVSANSS